MKSLHTLLKVAQRKLDEIAVESARITQEVAALNDREANIRAREQAEIANAAQEPAYAAMLPAYRMRVKQQIAEVRAQATAKEKALEEIRQRLSEAYIEKSKFEQLIEQTRVREETERFAREQAQLDEAAINRAGGQGKYRRRRQRVSPSRLAPIPPPGYFPRFAGEGFNHRRCGNSSPVKRGKYGEAGMGASHMGTPRE